MHIVKNFICVIFGLECSQCKQAYIEYESQINRLLPIIDYICRNRDCYRSTITKRRKNCVFSVLQEARN